MEKHEGEVAESMGSISRIEDLPDVLLFNGILSQLDAIDLARLACCSTRLNKTAAADQLWYPIFIDNYPLGGGLRHHKRYNNDPNKGKEPPPYPWQTWHQAFCSKQADKLIGQWIKKQCDTISEQIERTIQREKWNPSSSEDRHGNSIVEVYKTMEKTVEEFFKLQLPMRVLQPTVLISVLDHALQAYTKRVVSQLEDIKYLIQPAPIVTRCKNEGAYAKKMVPDKRSDKVDDLTKQKLCVRLNSLHYADFRLNELENSIQKWWAQKGPHENVMEAFDGTRKAVDAAIDRICEFTGMKIIFWDIMRKSCLYINSVSRVRIVLQGLHSVLRELCDVIVDALRDRVVIWLLRASVKGLVRVLHHGGSSRVLSQLDATLAEEDLRRLKKIFTAHQRWRIRHKIVEDEAAPVQQILRGIPKVTCKLTNGQWI